MYFKYLISIAHLLHLCTRVQFSTLSYVNLLAKAMLILQCIAEQYLSTFSGALYFSPSDAHKVYIRNSNGVRSYLIITFS